MSAQERNADLKKNNFCTMSSVVYNDQTESPMKHHGSMEREFPSPERTKVLKNDIKTTKSHASARKEHEARMAKKSREKKTKSPNTATAAYPVRP